MQLRLNHIGLVVRSVSQSAELLRILGLKQITQPEPDPIQKVRACFFTTGEEQAVHIELLEPTDDSSPIANFLKKKGGGLHHLCFEVEEIDAISQALAGKGFRMVCAPVECVGYDRSFNMQCTLPTRIAFFILPGHLLLELLQKGK
jgi:methylmalonyl-CoA/ethylmalonyl-CoA epimerase